MANDQKSTYIDATATDVTALKNASNVPSFWNILKREFVHDKIAIFALGILAIIFIVIVIGSIVLDQNAVICGRQYCAVLSLWCRKYLF